MGMTVKYEQLFSSSFFSLEAAQVAVASSSEFWTVDHSDIRGSKPLIVISPWGV